LLPVRSPRHMPAIRAFRLSLFLATNRDALSLTEFEFRVTAPIIEDPAQNMAPARVVAIPVPLNRFGILPEAAEYSVLDFEGGGTLDCVIPAKPDMDVHG